MKYGSRTRFTRSGSQRVGVHDLLEEAGADDAAAAEDGGDFGEVQLPVVLALGFAHELEALGVGADFRAIQRIADGVDQFLAIAVMRLVERAFDERLCSPLDALFL